MSFRTKILGAVLAVVLSAIAFTAGTVSVAIESIQFDLRTIGRSIYEAHAKSGKWPARIDDLEGTEYLNMPYRRKILQDGVFVIVWRQDLDVNRAANRNRVLAYDNGGLLAWLGWVWACRGDLSIERLGADELAALKSRRP